MQDEVRAKSTSGDHLRVLAWNMSLALARRGIEMRLGYSRPNNGGKIIEMGRKVNDNCICKCKRYLLQTSSKRLQ